MPVMIDAVNLELEGVRRGGERVALLAGVFDQTHCLDCVRRVQADAWHTSCTVQYMHSLV